MKNGAWTPAEDAMLLRLRAEKTPYAQISTLMDRSVDALDRRYRNITMTPEKLRAKMDKSNLTRRTNRWGFRNNTSDPANVPADTMSDRDARLSTPRTLTASFFGDPPPGWSALDRKRQGASA